MPRYRPSSSFSYDPISDVCYRTLNFLCLPGYRVGCDGSVWTRWIKIPLLGGPEGTGTKNALGNVWKRKVCNAPKASGHFRVNLAGRMLYVHTLVLLAFAGPKPENAECCHANDNPADNDLSNLSWGSRRKNMADRDKNGKTAHGVMLPQAKLDENKVRHIRLNPNRLSIPQLASLFGVSSATIDDVVKGKTWRRVVLMPPN